MAGFYAYTHACTLVCGCLVCMLDGQLGLYGCGCDVGWRYFGVSLFLLVGTTRGLEMIDGFA